MAKKRKSGTSNKILLNIVKSFFLVMIIFFWGIFFHYFIGSVYYVNNELMSESLNPGMKVFVCKICCGIVNPSKNENMNIYFGQPSRGDIILFKSTIDDKLIFMRVLGIPGDKISYINNTILINSRIPKEDYYKKRNYKQLNMVVLKENLYFVSGDNRDLDFTGGNFEIINRQQIIGKIIFLGK